MSNQSPNPTDRTPVVDDKLYAIDLRDASPEKMRALRQMAINEGVSLSRLFARFVDEASAKLLAGPAACDPDGQAARAAGMDHAA